jgi:hypothetical protein
MSMMVEIELNEFAATMPITLVPQKLNAQNFSLILLDQECIRLFGKDNFNMGVSVSH